VGRGSPCTPALGGSRLCCWGRVGVTGVVPSAREVLNPKP